MDDIIFLKDKKLVQVDWGSWVIWDLFQLESLHTVQFSLNNLTPKPEKSPLFIPQSKGTSMLGLSKISSQKGYKKSNARNNRNQQKCTVRTI